MNDKDHDVIQGPASGLTGKDRSALGEALNFAVLISGQLPPGHNLRNRVPGLSGSRLGNHDLGW